MKKTYAAARCRNSSPSNNKFLLQNAICVFALITCALGCANTGREKLARQQDVRALHRAHLSILSIGMTKKEVVKIMGSETTTIAEKQHREIINNPYKREMVPCKDKICEVLYYYTDVKKRDWAITEDELTPVVFDNDKLIGWGRAFLENIKK